MWKSNIWGISFSLGHFYCIHGRLAAFWLPCQQSAVVLPGDACLCSHPQSHDQLVPVLELWKSTVWIHQILTHEQKTKWIWAFRHKSMKMFPSIKEAQLWHFNRILLQFQKWSFYPACAPSVTLIYCLCGASWLGQDTGVVIDPPVSLCLSLAGLIVYLGMMVGAFVWGGLADRIGRKQTLLISLSINSVFAFFSSFVQGYSSFLFCRLLSGVG